MPECCGIDVLRAFAKIIVSQFVSVDYLNPYPRHRCEAVFGTSAPRERNDLNMDPPYADAHKMLQPVYVRSAWPRLLRLGLPKANEGGRSSKRACP